MMNVRDAMSRIVLTAPPTTTVAEAASLMAQRQVGSTLVTRGGRLVGIFTERDIVKALSQDAAATQLAIEHWMTRSPETISPDTSLEQALQRMVDGRFRHLPVMEGDTLVGMLSMRDISRATVAREEAEA